TPFKHLVTDYYNGTKEDNKIHLAEIKEMNSYPQHLTNYFDMAEENINYRIMHHHCFSLHVLSKMMYYCAFKEIYCFNHPKDKLQNVYFGKKK
ncbi:unnamed protein product, partial [marine sediment metagenome]